MIRGEVWWVNFDPSLGGEIQKTRQAIVVSSDAANKALNRVQVVPVTNSNERLYPSEAYVDVNGERRKAMADQITTVSKQRCLRRMGRISDRHMQDLEHAIRVQLNL